MKIILATQNRHKFAEMMDILKDVPHEFICAADIEGVPEVDENQPTIEGNAIKKAYEIAIFTQLPALADDTGFFVEALNDEPGVFAARYAGEDCSYADNVRKILVNMQGKDNRKARFETVVALAFPDGSVKAVKRGMISGVLLHEAKGYSGFGYDPIFQPEGFTQTFAELSEQQKNQISHRARAFQAIIPDLMAL